MTPTSARLCCLGATLLLVSCREREVVTYRIPKEVEPKMDPATASAPASAGKGQVSAAPAAPMADTPVATAAGNALTWVAPTNWTAKPAGAMRKGSYSVTQADGKTADLAITAFPGDVGGESANVNRWRGQVQLPPLNDGELSQVIQRLEVHGLKIALVELTNPTAAAPTRLLGAMVPYGGATWFFKLLGPDALVAAEKPAFLNFLQTIQPAAPATAP